MNRYCLDLPVNRERRTKLEEYLGSKLDPIPESIFWAGKKWDVHWYNGGDLLYVKRLINRKKAFIEACIEDPTEYAY